MKRITFDISSSTFAANMAVKHNVEKPDFLLANKAVKESFFYVDNGLTVAEDVPKQ